jgi:hypothetical protein
MKSCPQCRAANNVAAAFCNLCGHQFKTQFGTPPPVSGPSPGPTTQFIPQDLDFALGELARRHKIAHSTMMLTIYVGILVFPVWIISYLEYNKTQAIQAEVTRLGVSVQWWQSYYRTK